MRHGKKFNHLSRKAPHRKAMLANMASSLLMHKRINTTVAKAKALRTFIEPLLTRSKDDSTHSRRTAFRYLRDKYAVTELFRDIAPKIADRPGGYTRILKTGNRLGDNAEMCMIELVDFNETMLSEPKSTGAGAAEKKPRTRRGRKKATDDAPTASAKADASTDESSVAKAKEEASQEAKEESKPVVEDAEIVEEEVEIKEEKATEAEIKTEETTEEVKPEEVVEDVKEEEPEAKADVSSEAVAKEEEAAPESEEESKEDDAEEDESSEASAEDEEKKD